MCYHVPFVWISFLIFVLITFALISFVVSNAVILSLRPVHRVKSLDCEGVGALYKDVYRVDLQDMHDQLRAVKRVLQSATP